MKSTVKTVVKAITDADSEYSFTFPQNTRGFRLQARDTTAIRYASEAGKVATPTDPYNTLKANGVLEVDGIKLPQTTIYFAAAAGSKVVEITYWTGIDRAS